MAGRKQDYRVVAMNKLTDVKGNVGGAWRNDDGTITIILNAFIHLDAKDLLITLFPEKKET